MGQKCKEQFGYHVIYLLNPLHSKLGEKYEKAKPITECGFRSVDKWL